MANYAVMLNDVEGVEMERRATERGYPSVADYIRALVEVDALVDALREDWQDAEESPEVLEANLRQSWHEAMTGQTLPISALWEALAGEE